MASGANNVPQNLPGGAPNPNPMLSNMNPNVSNIVNMNPSSHPSSQPLNLPPNTANPMQPQNMNNIQQNSNPNFAPGVVSNTPNIRPPSMFSSQSILRPPPGMQQKAGPPGPQPGRTAVPVGTGNKITVDNPNEILSRNKLKELAIQASSTEKLDPEVEEVLIEIADDFIESVTNFACNLAKHRKSDTLEVKDVALHLERSWNIKIPGYISMEESKNVKKKPPPSQLHKDRLATIKKSAQNSTSKKRKRSNSNK